jgi:hypothetical protein
MVVAVMLRVVSGIKKVDLSGGRHGRGELGGVQNWCWGCWSGNSWL